MEAEFARYKTALTSSGSSLASSSVNGQAFSFGPRRDWSLMQWGRNVHNALAQVDPASTYSPPTGQIRVRFGGSC